MRLALVSKKSKVLYFLPFCFYQDKMVFNNKNSQHNFYLSIEANDATIAGFSRSSRPFWKNVVIHSMGYFKFQKCSLCFYGFFTHFTTFYSFSGVPFPPSNKLTMAEVFDPRTNKPRTEVKYNWYTYTCIFLICID